MVVKVELKGLNIVQSKGAWYVYVRETKVKLLGGFKGTRGELLQFMAKDPGFLSAYNAERPKPSRSGHPEGTLGALITWFETECPEYQKLSPATQKDYTAAFRYLRPGFDFPLSDIDQVSLYGYRDTCAREKWPRFADKMISALSSMFSQAVKRGKMKGNPALGISKLHAAKKNANREWTAQEVAAAVEAAPEHLRTVLMIARYAGFRGQTIAALTWREYQDDPSYGKCFRVMTRKNGEMVWVPAAVELQEYLAGVTKSALHICTRSNGSPWETEVQMQTEVSHLLRDLEKKGVIGAGTTLHGLRVTYAADLRRDGADAGSVAAALGDKSERMGAHYTRHVENEAKVVQAFARKKRKTEEQR